MPSANAPVLGPTQDSPSKYVIVKLWKPAREDSLPSAMDTPPQMPERVSSNHANELGLFTPFGKTSVGMPSCRVPEGYVPIKAATTPKSEPSISYIARIGISRPAKKFIVSEGEVPTHLATIPKSEPSISDIARIGISRPAEKPVGYAPSRRSAGKVPSKETQGTPLYMGETGTNPLTGGPGLPTNPQAGQGYERGRVWDQDNRNRIQNHSNKNIYVVYGYRTQNGSSKKGMYIIPPKTNYSTNQSMWTTTTPPRWDPVTQHYVFDSDQQGYELFARGNHLKYDTSGTPSYVFDISRNLLSGKGILTYMLSGSTAVGSYSRSWLQGSSDIPITFNPITDMQHPDTAPKKLY